MNIAHTNITYDDRLTPEQRETPTNIIESHHIHVYQWTFEAFMEYVKYTAKFVGSMTRLSDAPSGAIVYANQRRALSYNGHVTDSDTVMYLHDVDGPVPASTPVVES